MPTAIEPIKSSLTANQPFKTWFEPADALDVIDSWKYVADVRDLAPGKASEPEIQVERIDHPKPARNGLATQLSFQVPALATKASPVGNAALVSKAHSRYATK